MRLSIGPAAITLAGLLGGGVVTVTIVAPAIAANASAQEMTSTTNTSAEADRAGQIAACVADPPVRLPEGADANLVCSCAVDRMTTAEVIPSDAILQCAVQQRASIPQLRASEIGGCTSGASDHLPDGTDANVFCTCAVDKMLTRGTPQLDAVNQCATEMRITLRNMD